MDTVEVYRLVDAGDAPEIFADEAAGVYYLNGAMRITFASHRVDHSTEPGPVSRHVTGRVVLTAPAAKVLRDLLTEFIARLEMPPPADKRDAADTIN